MPMEKTSEKKEEKKGKATGTGTTPIAARFIPIERSPFPSGDA